MRPTVRMAVAAILAAAIGSLLLVTFVPDDPAGDQDGSPVVGTGHPVLRLSAGAVQPAAGLSIGSVRVDGMLDDGCWKQGDDLMSCVRDRLFGATVPDGFLRVPPSATLLVESDAADVGLMVGRGEYPFEDRTELRIQEGRAVLPATSGRYALIVDAQWPQGHAIFYLGIHSTERGSE